MSSRPRRLAVLAVVTAVAASPGTADAAAAQRAGSGGASHGVSAKASSRWRAATDAPASRPPENVVALARSIGVDEAFAWKTLDQLAREAQRTRS